MKENERKSAKKTSKAETKQRSELDFYFET